MLVVYHYNNSTTYLDGCGYHVPNTPINNELVTVNNGIESAPFPGVASLALSPFDNTIVGGVVYTDLTTTHIQIFKYLSDTGGWALLGLYDTTSIQDLSLSVGQDSNVWVTWGQTWPNAQLCASRVSLSASSSPLTPSVLIPNWNGEASAGGHAISMTYDPQAVRYIDKDTCYGVRLAFLNDTGTGTTRLWESPLVFDRAGQISFQYLRMVSLSRNRDKVRKPMCGWCITQIIRGVRQHFKIFLRLWNRAICGRMI